MSPFHKPTDPKAQPGRTALADAFLRALFAWAARQTRDQRITLPVGRVHADVHHALLHARSEASR
jgi:hypothetical protein